MKRSVAKSDRQYLAKSSQKSAVLRGRFFDGEGRQPTKGAVLTTAEVAKRLHLSEQRVRELERKAFRKLAIFVALREHLE